MKKIQKIRFTERNQGPSNINAAASPDIKKVAAIQAVIDQSKYGTLQRVGNSYWDACKIRLQIRFLAETQVVFRNRSLWMCL